MPRTERSIEIAAPVEVVFEYVADFRNALRWMHNFSRFEPEPGTPPRGLGARVQATGTAFGIPVSTRLEVVEYVPNQRLASRTTGRVTSASTWTFEPLPGGTRVTFTGSYELPAILARMIGSGEIERELGQSTEQSLRNLKRNLESAERPL